MKPVKLAPKIRYFNATINVNRLDACVGDGLAHPAMRQKTIKTSLDTTEIMFEWATTRFEQIKRIHAIKNTGGRADAILELDDKSV